MEDDIYVEAISDDGIVTLILDGEIEYDDDGYGMGAGILEEEGEILPVVVFEGKYYI